MHTQAQVQEPPRSAGTAACERRLAALRAHLPAEPRSRVRLGSAAAAAAAVAAAAVAAAAAVDPTYFTDPDNQTMATPRGHNRWFFHGRAAGAYTFPPRCY
jgi:ferric-dicitrate binding protein FerR (iron transport regulator)